VLNGFQATTDFPSRDIISHDRVVSFLFKKKQEKRIGVSDFCIALY